MALIGPLITIPLALKYLGMESFGVWMTIASTVGILQFTDLGIGNGLLTAIASADGRGDRESASRCISSAFFTLSAVALALLAVAAISYWWVPWAAIFGVKSPEAAQLTGPAMLAFLVCFALNLPMGIVQKIQSGYQEGYHSNLWQCAASAAALCAIVLAVLAKARLPVLVVAMAGVPLVVSALNWFSLLGRGRSWLLPRARLFDWPTAKNLLATGVAFMLISALMSIAYASDNLIVAHTLGAESVVQLSVPARLAAVLVAVPAMLYLPMWAANSEALVKGDVAWVFRNALHLCKLSALLTGAGAIAFVLFGPVFIHVWAGPEVEAGFVLMAGLALWSLLIAIVGPAFMVLNSAGVIWIQVAMHAVFAFSCIPCKVIFAKLGGVQYVPWATAGCYLLFILIPVVLVFRYLHRNLLISKQPSVITTT